jgi:hypothetical protein
MGVIRALRSGAAVVLAALPAPSVPGQARAESDPNAVAEAAVVAALPFEMLERNRIYVDLAPEGNRPFVLMLDTGAQHSVLTPGAARRAGVSVRRTKSSPYRRATRLGRDLQFHVDDESSDMGARTGWEYGLLGGNFLEKYVLELDFVNARVRFLDPGKYRVPERADGPGEAVVPIRVSGRRPFTRLERGGAHVDVLLDTGAPMPLLLSGPAASRLGLDPDAMSDFGAVGGVLGPISVKIHRSRDLGFAGFDLGATPVLVAPRGAYNQGGSSDSALGFDVLSQFTIRIDYPRQRMWLRRERATMTFLGYPTEGRDDAGAIVYGLEVEGAYRVLDVSAGSAAAALGLLPGDAIARHQQGRDWSAQETLERIAKGTPLRVRREAGRAAAVDVKLPDAAAYDAWAARAVEESARKVAEEERARLEAWERDKSERIYSITPAGYQLVDEWQKRRGPQEGEEWVTYEELRRRQAEQKEAAGE